MDDRLRNKIFEGAFVSERIGHEECMEFGIYQQLWDGLQSEKSYLASNFYLTENGELGIILGVSHSMGDYLTFEAYLGNIEDNLIIEMR